MCPHRKATLGWKLPLRTPQGVANAMHQRAEDAMDEVLVRSTNRQRADSEHYGTRSKDGGKDKATGRDIFPATIQDTRVCFGPIELK